MTDPRLNASLIDQLTSQDRLESVQGGDFKPIVADSGEWVKPNLAGNEFYMGEFKILPEKDIEALLGGLG